MLYQTFSLGDEYPEASLTAYVCDTQMSSEPRPALIVCPGGGYATLSPREGEPIVRRFLADGFNVFLLEYSVGEKASNYAPLIEAARAIKLVRQRAAEDNTDPQRVFIMGFSAGAHLAASAGTLWKLPEVCDAIGVSSGACAEGIHRPNGMVLCYPVISGGKYTHDGSILAFSGRARSEGLGALTEQEIEKFSLELHVDTTTPPAFLFHTFEDKVAPIQNSLLFINALAEANVPFEAHLFPEGPHGLALCNEDTMTGNERMLQPRAECWAELASKWMKSR